MKVVAIVFVLMIGFGIVFLLFQRIFYTIGVTIYHFGILVASLFNKKAKLWISGRKELFKRLEVAMQGPEKKTVWFHCASLGEFEQARPVIEKLKKESPQVRILLTFYSPSGYEVRKDYAFADHVNYFPADTRANAKKFIAIAKPDIAIFIKYEFWYHHIHALKQNNIPLYLVAGIFRKKQLFFKWYAPFFKQILKKYTRLFVQNEESLLLLKKNKLTNAELCFDTRFDRVAEIAAISNSYSKIEEFCSGFNIIIGGSTWPADEELLRKGFYKDLVYVKFKLIIVPHNIDAKTIRHTQKRFKKYSLLWSQLDSATSADLHHRRILIIDNIGMLSSLYKYADINFIGGGFGKGIHNTLEAAVYGKPIMFGPKYKKFYEAVELVKHNSAFVIRDHDELINRLNLMNQFPFIHTGAGKHAKAFVLEHTGGTQMVVNEIEKQLALA